MKRKPESRDCHGVLLLDKPPQLTSNQILQQIKRLYCARKAGHTGSLDPLATGLLPICFGRATKLATQLLAKDKSYQVTAKLGVKTTTCDTEGQIIAERAAGHISVIQIESVLTQFRGDIMQVPSMYSALKYQGQPLYRLARQGKIIERAPRAITIHRLDILSCENTLLSLDIHCSKGTYVRNLVDDIGDILGCGAHVVALRRTAIDSFTGQIMYTIEQLRQIAESTGFAGLDACLLSLS